MNDVRGVLGFVLEKEDSTLSSIENNPDLVGPGHVLVLVAAGLVVLVEVGLESEGLVTFPVLSCQ